MSEECDQMWKEAEYLNEYQLAAVVDDSPACIVNANVGSGKTTVLIEKILYLHFEKHVPLERMVVLTFTNKAANEIITRLTEKEPSLTKEQVQCFGTFHGVALFLLKHRLPVEQAGWTKDFAVMDPDEEADLAAELIAAQKLNVKYKNRLKKRLEQEYGGYLQGRETSRHQDDLFCLYPILEAEKKNQNKMTFSDLLRVSTALLMEESEQPDWIIVDEVQDSDAMQLDFLAALRGRETKLFAVGDPNQVIYSWRGTTQNTFYVLKSRFTAKELSLPINYRSNASILEAANRFLQFGNKIQGTKETGNRIVVKNYYDPFQEAEYLAERIWKLHEDGRAYREIAVFYRLQKQSEVLEKVFERHGIPFEVSVRKTTQDIPVLNWFVKVLRFSCNPSDEQMGVQALMNGLYGERCTKKKAKDIVLGQKKEASALYRRMAEFSERWACDTGELPELSMDGKVAVEGEVQEFSADGRIVIAEGAQQDGAGIPSGEEVFTYFGLREALCPTSAFYAEDERLVLKFLQRVCDFCKAEGLSFVEGTREFVNSSALYGINLFEDGADEERDAVRLMTLHASKGLEFDTVFLIGVNQGLIPLHSQDMDQEEEESRLFFVGITRARDELELSYYTNPGEPRVLGECSRYVRRIPEHLLEWDEVRSDEERRGNLQALRREVVEQRKRGGMDVSPAEGANVGVSGKEIVLADGDEIQSASVKEGSYTVVSASQQEQGKVKKVRHAKYGVGVVVREDEMMIEAELEGYGRKEFLKGFGEVEILNR